MSKNIHMPFGREGLDITVADSVEILEPPGAAALADPVAAIESALERPIGTAAFRELLAERKPASVAITVSDITRPVPNKVFLPVILKALDSAGVTRDKITIIIANGMHRPSTPAERAELVGEATLCAYNVIDHNAQDVSSMQELPSRPGVFVNRHFLQADFRIVTGLIEPHFMAGFSGGPKGVCPGLVDLHSVRRFHGYHTLANPKADTAILDGNPCQEIAMDIARAAGADFLFNVAITHDRKLAGVYCGQLEQAHRAGCRDVASWNTVNFEGHFDLLVTSGGGYPLDATFYQSVKCMCAALPALVEHSTLLVASQCAEGLGSKAYIELLLSYGGDWRRFLRDIASRPDDIRQGQWQYQMQCRVLERIGQNRLWLICQGLPLDMQRAAAVNPIICEGQCRDRLQFAMDEFAAAQGEARIGVVPGGPYTILRAG